jgi:hypothetical protein
MSRKPLYKVIFLNQGKVYEIYARGVQQGALFGFIEVEKIVFGERSSVVVDPSEESLKSEFSNVARTYIPLHAVMRIDEVNKQGSARITEMSGTAANVTPFPVYSRASEDSKS